MCFYQACNARHSQSTWMDSPALLHRNLLISTQHISLTSNCIDWDGHNGKCMLDETKYSTVFDFCNLCDLHFQTFQVHLADRATCLNPSLPESDAWSNMKTLDHVNAQPL